MQTHRRMSPVSNKVLNVAAGGQQEKVSPFIVAYIQTTVLVHSKQE